MKRLNRYECGNLSVWVWKSKIAKEGEKAREIEREVIKEKFKVNMLTKKWITQPGRVNCLNLQDLCQECKWYEDW